MIKNYGVFFIFSLLLVIAFLSDAYSTYLVISTDKGVESNPFVFNFDLISLLISIPTLSGLIISLLCVYLSEIKFKKSTLEKIVKTNNIYFLVISIPYIMLLIKFIATANNYSIYLGNREFLHSYFDYFTNKTYGLALIIFIITIILNPVIRWIYIFRLGLKN